MGMASFEYRLTSYEDASRIEDFQVWRPDWSSGSKSYRTLGIAIGVAKGDYRRNGRWYAVDQIYLIWPNLNGSFSFGVGKREETNP